MATIGDWLRPRCGDEALETGGKAMDKGKSISIATVGLVVSLLAIAPKAEGATFTAIDFPGSIEFCVG